MAGNLDGSVNTPYLPFNDINAGAYGPYGAMIPPAGAVFFVRGNGTTVTYYSWDPPGVRERLNASVAVALTQCVAARGDRVIVLEGHTENIATADAWPFVTGVTVVGVGTGANRPTITWTATGSSVLMNDANCKLINLNLNLDPGSGTVTVAAPITASVAGCQISNCSIRFSTDSNSLSTVPINLASCVDFTFNGNRMYGATAGECTTAIDIVAADRLTMWGNHIAGATSSTSVGIVRFKTTASLHIDLRHNFYANRKASSAAAVTGLAGVSGASFNELFHYLDNTSTTMWITSPGIMAFYNPRTVNLAGEAGMLSTVVST